MRRCEERTFAAMDGAQLFYRHWPRIEGSGHSAVLLLHRGHEHSGRLQHLADELNLPEHSLFAWDARGHGRSPGPRGCAPSFGALVKDLDTFVHHIRDQHGIAPENIAILSQSVGSVLAATWVHDYAPKIRCMVLASPAFQIKLYVPFARPVLKLLYKLRGDFTVKSYVKAHFLTHDQNRIREFEHDRLITRDISVKVLLELYDTAARIVADAAVIETPTQLLISGADWVVQKKTQLQFFQRLGSSLKEKRELKGFYHDTFGEKDRHLAVGKAREFVLDAFAEPVQQPSLLNADQSGATKDEYDRLRRPLWPIGPKTIIYGAMKSALKTGGRLSDGIRVGLEYGFDSGSSLDYVYRNQASGFTPLGKFVDWLYINSIGWRGIRVRKQHLQQMIVRAIAELRTRGLPVNLVDAAAGHGRYVLDSIEPHAASVDHILLRDYSPLNVQKGSVLIGERRLPIPVRFEQGDAFDRRALARIEPRPTLAVVSGLYELFAENAPVRESLGGLADAISPCGYLVYTGQPWHPQLEFISRTLSSHRDHKPWIMRRRTQAELDELVEAAGFRKVDQMIDNWGIFTVSLAQKVAA